MQLGECLGLELLAFILGFPYFVLAILLGVASLRIHRALYQNKPKFGIPENLARALRQTKQHESITPLGVTAGTPESVALLLARVNLIEAALVTLRSKIEATDEEICTSDKKQKLEVKYTLLFLEQMVLATEQDHIICTFDAVLKQLTSDLENRISLKNTDIDLFQRYWPGDNKISFKITCDTAVKEDKG
jgi:hypothetical protein